MCNNLQLIVDNSITLITRFCVQKTDRQDAQLILRSLMEQLSVLMTRHHVAKSVDGEGTLGERRRIPLYRPSGPRSIAPDRTENPNTLNETDERSADVEATAGGAS